MTKLKKKCCPVCNSKKHRRTFNGYYECKKCLVLFISTFPSSKELQKRANYWGKRYVRDAEKDEISQTDIQRVAYLKERIHKQIGKSLLDVGCGSGAFLKEAKKEGFSVTGMDISRPIVKYLSSQNIPATYSLRKIKRKYSFVTSFDVIEHTIHPRNFIRSVSKLVKKDGLLLITTPNSKGISARILKGKWWVFGGDDHVVMFNTAALRQLLVEEGFMVLEERTDIITQWINPSNNVSKKVINKFVYIILTSFQSELFKRSLGDNMQILAIKT